MSNDLPSSPAEAASFLERILHKQVQIQAKKVGELFAQSATTIKEIGSEIERRHPSVPATQVGANVGSYLDGVADYLSHTDGSTMIVDAERSAAAQPAVAIVAAATIGFVAARVVRAAGSGRSSA